MGGWTQAERQTRPENVSLNLWGSKQESKFSRRSRLGKKSLKTLNSFWKAEEGYITPRVNQPGTKGKLEERLGLKEMVKGMKVKVNQNLPESFLSSRVILTNVDYLNRIFLFSHGMNLNLVTTENLTDLISSKTNKTHDSKSNSINHYFYSTIIFTKITLDSNYPHNISNFIKINPLNNNNHYRFNYFTKINSISSKFTYIFTNSNKSNYNFTNTNNKFNFTNFINNNNTNSNKFNFTNFNNINSNITSMYMNSSNDNEVISLGSNLGSLLSKYTLFGVNLNMVNLVN